MVRVAINGFGRIGRMVFRAGRDREDIEFVAINDLTDTATLAHLLKYDTVHGTLSADVSSDEHHLYVDGDTIPVYNEKDPEHLPWADHDVDVVVESTGFFRTRDKAAKHLAAGAKKVLLSAPAKSDGIKTLILGINEHEYSPDEHDIVSNASCTSNSLAPLVKVIDDNYGINHGFFATVHSVTSSQNMIDGPHKDLRRARAATGNIVPTTSGAAIAVTKTLPALDGKLTGGAYRVPTLDGSITEFYCHTEQPVTREQVNQLFKDVAHHHLKGVLRYTEEPLVSSDIIGDAHSCVFDAQSTEVVDGHMLRVLGWYDNEWGYSCRMVDLIAYMAAQQDSNSGGDGE